MLVSPPVMVEDHSTASADSKAEVDSLFENVLEALASGMARNPIRIDEDQLLSLPSSREATPLNYGLRQASAPPNLGGYTGFAEDRRSLLGLPLEEAYLPQGIPNGGGGSGSSATASNFGEMPPPPGWGGLDLQDIGELQAANNFPGLAGSLLETTPINTGLGGPVLSPHPILTPECTPIHPQFLQAYYYSQGLNYPHSQVAQRPQHRRQQGRMKTPVGASNIGSLSGGLPAVPPPGPPADLSGLPPVPAPAQPAASATTCPPVPKPEYESSPETEPEKMSVGSMGHPVSCSRGCKYVWKPKGCKDGANCKRCHYCPWRRATERETDNKD